MANTDTAPRKPGRPKVLKGTVRWLPLRVGDLDELYLMLRADVDATGEDEATVHRAALLEGLRRRAARRKA